MNLWRRLPGQRLCSILYVVTPWSKKENKAFTSDCYTIHSEHAQIYSSLKCCRLLPVDKPEVKSNLRSGAACSAQSILRLRIK